MRLLRVQVPEFRALKDVDISFESDFNPQVFPLGSLNGGGKSTLLQLIFVLLHNFADVSQSVSLENVISDLIAPSSGLKILAEITLLSTQGELSLTYLYGNEESLYRYKELIEKKNLQVGCSRIFIAQGISYIKTITYNNPIIDKESKNFDDILKEIQDNIFLISPSNQPYLFLSRDERRVLFTKDNKSQYDQAVKNAQAKLPNFFMFDFVDVLTEVFRMARKKDIRERNKNNPFAHLEKLEKNINSLFIDGKKIQPLIDEEDKRHTQDEIQGVFFKLPDGTEIYPEDLSHGELKRLAIFVLIKYHEMQDAVVLIDEIENGFHPRWQRHIPDDLVEWGASNQYILATHSYEVCRNLTFEHIKEFEPKLTSDLKE